MSVISLIVPVMKNFRGFAELIRSVDNAVVPIIIDNWRENIGVSKAWNVGLHRAMDTDAAVIVNDDVILAPGTLEKMVGHLRDYDLVSAIGGDTGKTGVLESLGADSPDYACFAVKPKDFVEKFGTFDENFSPAYFEDNDMRYRIKVGGGKQGVVLDARMVHEGSVTQNFGGIRVVSHQMFEKNRTYFVSKWGGLPGQETYITPFNDSTRTIKDW